MEDYMSELRHIIFIETDRFLKVNKEKEDVYKQVSHVFLHL